jgi:D-alanyl-D-alanine carboxypeptidase
LPRGGVPVQEGLTIVGGVAPHRRSPRNGGGRELLRLTTPMARVLPVMLKESQNRRAEMISQASRSRGRGRASSFRGGCEVVAETLSGLGVRLEGLCPHGRLRELSRSNRVTARALYDALSVMGKRPDFEAYRDLSPNPAKRARCVGGFPPCATRWRESPER